MRGVLSSGRDLRLIVGAVGISAAGDVLLWVPMTLHLEAMTDSGIAVAGFFLALWSPVVLLAPIAGLIVDRNEARRVLIIASLVQAGVAVGLALALDSLALLFVLTAMLGVANAISQPAEFALVPVIAGSDDPRRLTRINGYVETGRYVGMVVGPALGGVLAAAGGVDVALLVDAASFALVAAAGTLLAARRPAAVTSDGTDGSRARDGIVYLIRDRVLAIVIGASFVSLLFMTATVTAEVFFLKEDVGVGDAVYGLVFASWTIGMVIGAVAVAPRIGPSRLALTALLMIGLQGLGLGLPTVLLVASFAAAMWFIGGIGHGTKNVLVRTLIQARVPDRLHGRAFAAYNGLRNGAELFALAAGGAMVAALGGRVTLALAGGFAVLAALGGLAVYARRGGEGAGAVEPGDFEVEGVSPATAVPGAAE